MVPRWNRAGPNIFCISKTKTQRLFVLTKVLWANTKNGAMAQGPQGNCWEALVLQRLLIRWVKVKGFKLQCHEQWQAAPFTDTWGVEWKCSRSVLVVFSWSIGIYDSHFVRGWTKMHLLCFSTVITASVWRESRPKVLNFGLGRRDELNYSTSG